MATVNGRRRALAKLVTTALAAACIAVLAPWAIPVGAVPMTLGLLGVFLAGSVLGAGRGGLAVLVYLSLGAVGVPVFGGFTGGIGCFLSPTGGFLIGYFFCALIVGLSRKCRKTWLLPAFMACGLLVCYALGAVWYGIMGGLPFSVACAASILPFLPADAVKLVAACLLTPPLRRACAAIYKY